MFRLSLKYYSSRTHTHTHGGKHRELVKTLTLYLSAPPLFLGSCCRRFAPPEPPRGLAGRQYVSLSDAPSDGSLVPPRVYRGLTRSSSLSLERNTFVCGLGCQWSTFLTIILLRLHPNLDGMETPRRTVGFSRQSYCSSCPVLSSPVLSCPVLSWKGKWLISKGMKGEWHMNPSSPVLSWKVLG